jgi:hypothetical protein
MAGFMTGHDDFFAHRTLYAWVTAEQIAEIQERSSPLATPTGDAGRMVTELERLAAGRFSLAVLDDLRFDDQRLAWNNAWAILLDGDGEMSGDRLLSITLEDDAIMVGVIGDFQFRDGRFGSSPGYSVEYFDVSGERVDEARVDEIAARIAAVYFAELPACNGSGESVGVALRQYVILNEAMIRDWTVDGATSRAQIQDSIQGLRSLRETIVHPACDVVESMACWPSAAADTWSTVAADETTLLRMYARSLAVANDMYRPAEETLDRLMEALSRVSLIPDGPRVTDAGSEPLDASAEGPRTLQDAALADPALPDTSLGSDASSPSRDAR